MEQPQNFGFGEDEAMLRDSAKRFFADNLPPDRLHHLVAGESDPRYRNQVHWDESLWQQVVELGWLAAVVPEAAGGIGLPLVAAVALAEEAGRAAFPSPLQATFSAAFVLAQCASTPANELLGQIAEGTAVSLAVTNATGSLKAADTDVSVLQGNKLSGTAYYVQEARKVGQFVVSARSEEGVGLYLVDADSNGLTIESDAIVDLTRDQARLHFKQVSGVELASPGVGAAALEAALPAQLCIAAADMVGAGEWLLQTTAEYARTRVQFDRAIGFFQAIKHPLVNLMIEIDNARSLTYNASCAVDVDAADMLTLARMANAQASEMAVYSGSRAVQFHGGIGFTWECYVQMYFKRQLHSQVLLGDAIHHRRALAHVLVGEVAA